MIASTLLSLALSLTVAQARPAFHAGATDPALHASPPAEEATPEAGHGVAGDHEAAVADHLAAAAGHQAAASGHEAAAGGHDLSLGAVMMHHVTDGYVIEHPGFCEGGLRWNCELKLEPLFGTTGAPHTASRAGPLVFAGGALDMTPTKHVVMMWLASALLLLVIFGALRRKALVPRGLYNFIELLVAFVRNELAVPNIGKENADRFLPYLLTAFFFILFVNLFGLLPFAATATANINVTVCMALFTFVITQYAAIRAQGLVGYLKHLTAGVHWLLWPIMVPVEILGLFTKPFALTIRLFANMVAGHFVILALLGLIYAISAWVAPVSVGLALAIFMLELFVGFVQAYIFTLLSALFIGAGFAHHGHDEHEEHGPAEQGGLHHPSHVAGASPGHG
jgi:F-type H+-transporting ATPase subunit a